MNYSDDIKGYNIEQRIAKIADKWRGIPLKGKAQEELIEDFKKENITDNQRKAITTFRKCCCQFSNYGIQLKTKKATKEDLSLWPQYLTTPREEFKIIV